MKTTTSLFLIFLISHLLMAGDYNEFLDIKYKNSTETDKQHQVLDIVMQTDTSTYSPVIIYIHGGSWNSGDKNGTRYKAEFFTENGFVFVSINYRLSPNPPDTANKNRVMFPAHAMDAAAAVRWVYDSIPQFFGDTSRIYLLGHSAGAQIAGIISTNPQFLTSEELPLSSIKAVCLLDAGSLDLPMRFKQLGRKYDLEYVNAFSNDEKLWYEASPAHNIRPNLQLPEFLIIHQAERTRAAINNSFRDSLVANGYICNQFIIENMDHNGINDIVGNPNDTSGISNAILDFFKNYLLNNTEKPAD